MFNVYDNIQLNHITTFMKQERKKSKNLLCLKNIIQSFCSNYVNVRTKRCLQHQVSSIQCSVAVYVQLFEQIDYAWNGDKFEKTLPSELQFERLSNLSFNPHLNTRFPFIKTNLRFHRFPKIYLVQFNWQVSRANVQRNGVPQIFRSRSSDINRLSLAV